MKSEKWKGGAALSVAADRNPPFHKFFILHSSFFIYFAYLCSRKRLLICAEAQFFEH